MEVGVKKYEILKLLLKIHILLSNLFFFYFIMEFLKIVVRVNYLMIELYFDKKFGTMIIILFNQAE